MTLEVTYKWELFGTACDFTGEPCSLVCMMIFNMFKLFPTIVTFFSALWAFKIRGIKQSEVGMG
jgi:hypothetical protein